MPVLPKRRYLFSAYVRTEQITTDRGICFDIVDPRHPAEVQVFTAELVGTSPWTLVRAEVTTGPDTQ